MRRKQSLSSISIGRSFVYAPPADDEAPNIVGSVVRAASAWKIIDLGEGEVTAENAEGVQRVLSADLLVTEISREGFARLVEVFLSSREEE